MINIFHVKDTVSGFSYLERYKSRLFLEQLYLHTENDANSEQSAWNRGISISDFEEVKICLQTE